MGEAHEIDWDAAYWETMPRIYNYFCFRVGNHALAEDLTAVTFVKAWRAQADFDPTRGAIMAWLMGIARNVAADHFRAKHPTVALDDGVRLPIGDMRPVEEALQRSADYEQFMALMAELPAREREIVALKYGAELTNRAIAILTGVSESNVGTLLHRVVRRLRAAWEVQSHE